MENFNNFKFRASTLGNLFIAGRSKSETFGETAKNFLKETFIEAVYGRKKIIHSKYINKGVENEDSAILMLNNVLFPNEFLVKNTIRYENTMLTGMPDVVVADTVIDVKCSYDIFTFADAEISKMYYYQLQAYMNLVGVKKALLVFCLTNSPENILQLELEQNAENAEMVYKLHHYDDIPAKNRVKTFEVHYDQKFEEELEFRVTEARKILNTLVL